MPTLVHLKCLACHKDFTRSLSRYNRNVRRGCRNATCSLSCTGILQRTRLPFCKNCKKSLSQGQKKFCSRSCSCTFNNKNKDYGFRRSRLERFLEEKLRETDHEIVFNGKRTIGSELDIYFPLLALAFELNGIYHYKAIHGEEKLASVQENDRQKVLRCKKSKITLHVIDVSFIDRFSPSQGEEVLETVLSLVAEHDSNATSGS